MGCETGQDNERPVHRVWLDCFGLAKFPVTHAEYELFLDATGSRRRHFGRSQCLPIREIRW